MKQIVVTGAGGQLGSEMRCLSAAHPDLEFDFTDSSRLDVTDRQAVLAYLDAHPADIIVNCAAYTAVDRAEDDEEACRRVNALAPAYLAEAAEVHGATLIHVSTDYVFDGRNFRPYVETDATCPATVYGRTKLEGERRVLEGCSRVMVVRTSWLYSSYGNNFVKTMLRLGRTRSELGVVFDQVGTPTYAADLACALVGSIRQGIVPGLYHFSDEGVCSWYDLAKAVHRLAGITTCHVRPLHTDEYPTRACRPHYSVLDKTKIKQTYGIAIPHWEASLEACLKILNSQE